MKRGEIYYANLSPTIGSQMAKLRPVLIVSNDVNNRVSLTVTILPITSNVTRVYPFELLLPTDLSGLPQVSKALAQQIRTISTRRIRGEVVGSLNLELMRLVDAAIKLHLALT